MRVVKKIGCCILCVAIFAIAFCGAYKVDEPKYIKWVELNVSENVLNSMLELDIKYHGTESDFTFVNGLAYLSVKNGNNFSEGVDVKNIAALKKHLAAGAKMKEILPDNKYSSYYLQVYESIFGEYIGDYTTADGKSGYGLRSYFPLSGGYWYNHYDDFGSSRSFGFKRRHLGHDLMGSVGTPIIAVESGIVSECGWNRYGGWRIGVRTADTKRYYYYAHLRKNRPFAANLKLGDTVSAGQVIGYLGRTGYSSTENTNLKTGDPHLHFGLQLIYHPSQEKGNHEIWVDCYALTKFLQKNCAQTVKDTQKEATTTNLMQWR